MVVNVFTDDNKGTYTNVDKNIFGIQPSINYNDDLDDETLRRSSEISRDESDNTAEDKRSRHLTFL